MNGFILFVLSIFTLTICGGAAAQQTVGEQDLTNMRQTLIGQDAANMIEYITEGLAVSPSGRRPEGEWALSLRSSHVVFNLWVPGFADERACRVAGAQHVQLFGLDIFSSFQCDAMDDPF